MKVWLIDKCKVVNLGEGLKLNEDDSMITENEGTHAQDE